MMKRTLVLLAASILLLGGCKDKKTSNNDIITTDFEMPMPSETPVTMSSLTEQKEVQWVEGRNYRVMVTRMAVDSLPKVSDEIGQKYVDNQVKVTVMRADSTVFFNRTFTKSTFLNWLDGDYREHALLEGIRFLKAEGSDLVFVAWFNYPQAGDDEAKVLQLSVSRMGEVDIKPFVDNDRDDLEQLEQE